MECRLLPYVFTHTFFDKTITFFCVKMMKSLFVWIGDCGNIDSLAVAMAMLPLEGKPVTSTSLMGKLCDLNSSTLAEKLCKKTKKLVFASYNVYASDDELLKKVTLRLFEEINNVPEKF